VADEEAAITECAQQKDADLALAHASRIEQDQLAAPAAADVHHAPVVGAAGNDDAEPRTLQ